MLAVAFGPPTMAAACAGLPDIREQADCLELRLDLFGEPFDLPVILRERGKLPVVATLRPIDQGGKSTLPADERLRVLLDAAELGAEYVDLEYDVATAAAISSVRAAGAQVIASRHDFAAMPDLAGDWWPRLAELGADIVKVVGTARELRDCLQVFRALARADQPTIAIAMGEAGLITRVLALRADACFLTYAALELATGTAPGQLTIRDMRETYRAGRLRSTTRVFGLLGPHTEEERLREYNAWFDAEGFDGVAVPFVAEGDAVPVVAAFRELPVSGWHVHGTSLQTDVRQAMDELRPAAARQDKVNSVVRRARDGSLVGDWVESPREQYEQWCAEN
jgi:3-dehydroquinate dehydratase/shikimate dehydrogenase